MRWTKDSKISQKILPILNLNSKRNVESDLFSSTNPPLQLYHLSLLLEPTFHQTARDRYSTNEQEGNDIKMIYQIIFNSKNKQITRP